MLFNPLDARTPKTARSDLIGTVIDNDDSKSKDGKKRGRVRVRIPLLHRNVPDDKLPWSMPNNNTGQANAGAGVGGVRIPPIGAKVFYILDDEDPHNPRYGSSPSTDDVYKDNELAEEDYPHTYGDVDTAGNLDKVNTLKNTKTKTHVSGTTDHIDGSGNYSIFGVSNNDFISKGNTVIGADGAISAHAGGVNSIKGSRVLINCSDAFIQASAAGNRTRPVIASPAGKTKA